MPYLPQGINIGDFRIVGGTIDGAIIGGSDPEAGTFDDLLALAPDISVATDTTLTAAQCRGNIIYVTATATITLPAVTGDGMIVTVYSTTAAAVHVDANSSDRIVLNGTALDEGDKITSESQAGDFIALHNDTSAGWRTLGRSGIWTDGS